MMKKLLLTAVLIALVLSLAGCGQPKEEAPAVKLPLDELAATVGTINYELACQVSARVPRVVG